jgi:RNA recognition motif-containing protein
MISSIISNLYLSKKKIFIDGIPLNTTKAQIINFFKQYGEVDYCVINTDKYTNVSRGFGFLIFKNSISVKYCLNDKKNHYINGKWVEVKKASNKKKKKKNFYNFFDGKKIIYPIY